MSNAYDDYSNEEIQKIIDYSSSYKEIIEKFNLSTNGGNCYTILKRVIKERSLSIDGLDDRRKENLKKMKIGNKRPDEECFCENSTYPRNCIRKRILKENIIDYKCSVCGLEEWNKKEISLHIDHINGVNDDNRLENLRFLCPNCHSQTDTYAGRKKKKHYYCPCGNEIGKTSKICVSCTKKEQIKLRKFSPTKKELINKIKELNSNIESVGRYYEVTGNTIRKRCKLLKIDYKNAELV